MSALIRTTLHPADLATPRYTHISNQSPEVKYVLAFGHQKRKDKSRQGIRGLEGKTVLGFGGSPFSVVGTKGMTKKGMSQLSYGLAKSFWRGRWRS